MCGGEGGSIPVGVTRRQLLIGTAAAAGAAVLGRMQSAGAAAQTTADLGGVPVVPRAAWGGDLAPVGPIAVEPDVRYLLVHHSVDPGNDYLAQEVAGILRGFVRFHTSPTKGWPDLAYNFLVDRFGRVWEGRTGSLAGAVAGDATGGNQGFDQLCCFIGNHQTGQPTPEAFAAMAGLLRALAARHRIDLSEGATTSFTSRGSNRHPPGTVVRTATVAGHRDMSQTLCPGDRVYARLSELRLLAARATPAAAAAPPTTAGPTTTAPTTTTDPATTVAPASTASATTASTVPVTTGPSSAVASGPDGEGGGSGPPGALLGAGAGAVGAAAAGAVWAMSRRKATPEPDEQPSDGSSPRSAPTSGALLGNEGGRSDSS